MKKLIRRSGISLASLAAVTLSLPTPEAEAIIIQLDYTYDTFFTAGSANRARLEDAASFYENLLEDDLEAITPTGNYSLFIPDAWQINFENPATGGVVTVDDPTIAADTVRIYVGARTFAGSQLAEGGFGGAATFGSATFNNTVATRGETGVGTTDFAPWGGYISVDDSTTWDTTLAGNGTDQHLYSTLIHEIAHVLGVGTAPSWDAMINGSNEFTGTESVADYGGNVPLHFSAGSGRYDHWQDGLTSNIRGTTTSQETNLDPTINAGDVKLLTNLDVAALDDIGWDIAAIPEPSTVPLAAGGAMLLLRRRRS